MTKNDFLSELKLRLKRIKRAERNRILQYYSELIDDMTESGKTEAEAVEALGNIDDIAKQILADASAQGNIKNNSTWIITLLAILSFPVWVPILAAAFAILISVLAVLFSVIVSVFAIGIALVGSAVGLIFGSFAMLIGGSASSALFTLGSGLVCLALSLILAPLFFAFAKLIVKEVVKLWCLIFKKSYSPRSPAKLHLAKIGIASACIFCVGMLLSLCALGTVKFDITKLNTDKKIERISKTLSAADINTVEISVYTDNIVILPSTDDSAHISYTDTSFVTHVLNSDNGKLSLISEGNKLKWFEYIGLNFSFDNDVELYLPESYSGSIILRSTTGKVELSDFNGIKTVDITSSTGNINLSDIEAAELYASASTGTIWVYNITADTAILSASTGSVTFSESSCANSLTVSTTTGKVKLESCTIPSLKVTVTTGSIGIYAVTCEKSANLSSSTGSITLSDLLTKSLTAKTSTGDVKGTLRGSESKYAITSSSNTGNNNLAQRTTGERTISIHTSTGNIHITFSGK